eukprot:TRINITY_DN4474_c1_g1_i1.p1 TRINITY_DN4474_c1_g1~~TRINITY_DN4474_c1_g1_i1.p1  ORF type:complete len:319 (+),score=33.96 TRINITY_DN4474_c1_g1_i1:64-1020(+)
MQLSVTYPDTGFLDFLFYAEVGSLVRDVVQAAGDEWGMNADFLEVSFAGTVLPLNSKLMSQGVEADSELVVSLLRVFGRKWLVNADEKEKLRQHLSKMGTHKLPLVTSTFTAANCLQFEKSWIPLGVDSIKFATSSSAENHQPNNHPTTMSNNFLGGCTVLKELDVSDLRSLTTTGNGFLRGCSLTALDLSNFTNITSIGSSFLHGCSRIRTLNLSGLSNVTSLGNNFLRSCKMIKDLDLSSLSSVTSIGYAFLRGGGIKTLDLSGFKNVTTIGTGFLKGCSSITTLRINGLSASDQDKLDVQQKVELLLNRAGSGNK